MAVTRRQTEAVAGLLLLASGKSTAGLLQARWRPCWKSVVGVLLVYPTCCIVAAVLLEACWRFVTGLCCWPAAIQLLVCCRQCDACLLYAAGVLRLHPACCSSAACLLQTSWTSAIDACGCVACLLLLACGISAAGLLPTTRKPAGNLLLR